MMLSQYHLRMLLLLLLLEVVVLRRSRQVLLLQVLLLLVLLVVLVVQLLLMLLLLISVVNAVGIGRGVFRVQPKTCHRTVSDNSQASYLAQKSFKLGTIFRILDFPGLLSRNFVELIKKGKKQAGKYF